MFLIREVIVGNRTAWGVAHTTKILSLSLMLQNKCVHLQKRPIQSCVLMVFCANCKQRHAIMLRGEGEEMPCKNGRLFLIQALV